MTSQATLVLFRRTGDWIYETVWLEGALRGRYEEYILRENVKKYFSTEIEMEIGIKVRNVGAVYGANVIVRYGIVRSLDTACVIDRDPFINGVVDYDVAEQVNILGVAKGVRVSWHDCDGNQVCESWSQPDSLREFTDEDAERDANLPLMSTYGTPKS